MRAVLIDAGTQRLGQCRSCAAPVEWATLASGVAHPFDPPIVLAADESLIDDVHKWARVDLDRTRSHFATCPHAAKWRRKDRL